MKFRVTALREDLYRGNSGGEIEADENVKISVLELHTLMKLFLEMFDNMQ